MCKGSLVEVITHVVLFDPAHGDYICNHNFVAMIQLPRFALHFNRIPVFPGSLPICRTHRYLLLTLES